MARSSGSLSDLYSRDHEAAADSSVQQPSAMNDYTTRSNPVKLRRDDLTPTVFGKLYDRQGNLRTKNYGRRKPPEGIGTYYGVRASTSHQDLWNNVFT